MNTGLGNAAVRSSKVTPPVAPTVTAANDGVSLSGTTVKLGQATGAVGDPAILLDDREIPMNGHSFKMWSGGFGPTDLFFDIDTTAGAYSIGNKANAYAAFDDIGDRAFMQASNANYFQITGGATALAHIVLGGGFNYLSLDASNGLYQIGDIDAGAGNETQLVLDDALSTAKINNNGLNFLSIDGITNDHVLGDNNGPGSIKVVLSGTNAWSYLQGSKAYLGDFENGFDNTYFAVEDRLFFATSDGNEWFRIETTTGLCYLGDFSAAANGTLLTIDDAAQTITIQSAANRYLNIDAPNKIYSFGDIDNGTSVLKLNGTNPDARININGDLFMWIAPSSNQYSFGDINNVHHGSYFKIADTVTPQADIFLSTFSYLRLDKGAERYQIGDVDGTLNSTRLLIDNTTARITTNGSNQLIGTTTTFANNAGASLGTLTNAPAAGDPTKWIAIDDNGTTRYIPSW